MVEGFGNRRAQWAERAQRPNQTPPDQPQENTATPEQQNQQPREPRDLSPHIQINGNEGLDVPPGSYTLDPSAPDADSFIEQGTGLRFRRMTEAEERAATRELMEHNINGFRSYLTQPFQPNPAA